MRQRRPASPPTERASASPSARCGGMVAGSASPSSASAARRCAGSGCIRARASVAWSFEGADERQIEDRVGALVAEDGKGEAGRAQPAVGVEGEGVLDAGAEGEAVEAAVPAGAEIGAEEERRAGAPAPDRVAAGDEAEAAERAARRHRVRGGGAEASVEDEVVGQGVRDE